MGLVWAFKKWEDLDYIVDFFWVGIQSKHNNLAKISQKSELGELRTIPPWNIQESITQISSLLAYQCRYSQNHS